MSNTEKVIKEMIEAGESACFIGQVLKLHFTNTEFTPLHFYESGANKSQNEYRFQKSILYAEKLLK